MQYKLYTAILDNTGEAIASSTNLLKLVSYCVKLYKKRHLTYVKKDKVLFEEATKRVLFYHFTLFGLLNTTNTKRCFIQIKKSILIK